MPNTIRLSCLIMIHFLAFMYADVVTGQTSESKLEYPYDCVREMKMLEGGTRPSDIINYLRCKSADFYNARFEGLVGFGYAEFESVADFHGAKFEKMIDFQSAKFGSVADFTYAEFKSVALFNSKFESLANFSSSEFNDYNSFGNATFSDEANFHRAKFDSSANFNRANFNGIANFNFVTFNSYADFSGASFWDAVDFRNSVADATFIIDFDFSRAFIRDTIRIGARNSEANSYFDFRQAIFRQAGHEFRPADSVEVTIPGAAIVLYAPVQLDLQVEKIDFLHLADSLSYFQKSDIITYLKYNSFSDDNQGLERFELDYLLARSTMHQSTSGLYEKYPWYHPKLWWNYLYYYLMGFGYRPFRIFLWAGGMILVFGIYYRMKMPDQIYNYVQNDGEKHSLSLVQKHTPNIDRTSSRNKLVKIASRTTSSSPDGDSNQSENLRHQRLKTPWIHCLYFSTMVVFTFRLKQKLLVYFDTQETRIIVIQWVLGFLIYVAFLTLAKSGSILHQLKVLFVG